MYFPLINTPSIKPSLLLLLAAMHHWWEILGQTKASQSRVSLRKGGKGSGLRLPHEVNTDGEQQGHGSP